MTLSMPSPALEPLAPTDVERADLVELPPEDALPSRPTHGELVLSEVGVHPFFAVYVYADGRLIWERAELDLWPLLPPSGDFPEGPNRYTTGLLERRLTPEGVRLLTSEAVPLEGQRSLPADRLPARAWEDDGFTPYVPARYAICVMDQRGRPDTSRVFGVLPASARDLLLGRERMYEVGLPDQPFSVGCFQVTTEDAHALDRIFRRDARFGRDKQMNAQEVQYEIRGGFEAIGSMIWFEPVLPHGGIVLEGS